MNAEEIAAALGRPERQGPNWRALCPCHGGHSLTLRDGDLGILVRCWGGCESADVLRELRRRGFLEDRERENCERRVYQRPPPSNANAERALELWRARQPLIGSFAQAYLEGRRLDAADRPSLGFLPNVRHPTGVNLPALIAGVQHPENGRVVAVQLTFLDHRGRKTKLELARQTLGSLQGGAVRLGPAGVRLGLAEGLETAASAQAAFQTTCWATLGAARLARIAIPESVREIVIFADNDEAGRAAAERAFSAYGHARKLRIFYPPAPHGDWNDAATAAQYREDGAA